MIAVSAGIRAQEGVQFLGAGGQHHNVGIGKQAQLADHFNAVIAFHNITPLVDALRAKDDFVSSVSHELRTPLTFIMGYLDLAQEEAEDTGLTGAIPHAVSVAQRNSERLLRLVTDLLATASGSVSVDPRPVPVAELISTCLRAAAPRAAAAGVHDADARADIAGRDFSPGIGASRELGTPRVTMQAVAERVGVRAPSLYKRVRDRSALIDLVADAAVEELVRRLAATDGTLPAMARAYRAFAQQRPEGFRLLLSAAGDPSAPQRVSAPLLRAAEELVGPAQALDAARLVTAWATGFISMELAGAFRLEGDLERAFDYGLERLTAALSPASVVDNVRIADRRRNP